MTGPVEFLEAAHGRAEQTVDRLRNELWWIGNARHIEVYTSSAKADRIKFDSIGVDGRDVTVTDAIQHALLAASPIDLQRRVAAERKQLALHQNVAGKCDECGRGYELGNWGPDFPCTTVRLLAEGWGWTEETT